jgi:hypothetical protein
MSKQSAKVLICFKKQKFFAQNFWQSAIFFVLYTLLYIEKRSSEIWQDYTYISPFVKAGASTAVFTVPPPSS